MNLIKEKFKCMICNLIFETPVFLPCFNTICKKHSNDFIDKPCLFCKQVHEIPKDGSLKVNDILNDIILNEGYLLPNEKEARNELENANQDLNGLVEKFESKESALEVFCFDHFSDLMNKIEIQREELKIDIDTVSEKLVNQVKECKNKFKKHIQEVSDDFRNTFNKEKIKEQKVELIKSFRLPMMLDMEKIDRIKTEYKKRLNDLESKIIEIEKLEADAKKCSVDKKKSKLNESIFGKLTLVNPNKNQSIISGSSDGEIKIWDLVKGECYNNFVHQKVPVISLLLLPDNMLAIGYGNGHITIWNLNTSDFFHSFYAHKGSITDMLLLSNEVLVTFYQSSLKFWDLKSKEPQCLKEIQEDISIKCMLLVEYPENDIFCSKDQVEQTSFLKLFHNKILILGKSRDGDETDLSLSVLFINKVNQNVQTLKLIGTQNRTIFHNRNMFNDQYYQYNHSIVLNSFNKRKLIAFVEKDSIVFFMKEEYQNNQFQNSRTSIFGFRDQTQMGNLQKFGKLNTRNIKEKILIYCNQSKTRRASEIQSSSNSNEMEHLFREQDIEIISFNLPIQSRIFSLNGLGDNELAVCSNNDIYIINLSNNQQTKLSGHLDFVNDVKVSLVNNLIISCSNDKSLKIWDLVTKECVHNFTGHRNQVNTCVINENSIKFKQTTLETLNKKNDLPKKVKKGQIFKSLQKSQISSFEKPEYLDDDTY